MASVLIFSLILVVTLAVSGLAKVKDCRSTATAIFNLKIDHWLPVRVRTVAKVLPWAELFLALALFVVPGLVQIFAALCALLLFSIYWVVIARAVMSGNTASCNCFGSGSDAPISRWTLARNTALVLAAIVVLAAALSSGQSPLLLLLGLNLEQWLWLLGAALASATLWFIYRAETVTPLASQSASHTPGVTGSHEAGASRGASPYTNAEVAEEALEEDYVRLPIPFGQLTEYKGARVNLRQLASSQARVLLWVSPTCGPCADVIARIGQWTDKLSGMVGVHPVVYSEELAEKLEIPQNVTIFVDDNSTAQYNFGGGTPMAVALGADGLMAGGPVFGKGAVIDFMNDLLVEFDLA